MILILGCYLMVSIAYVVGFLMKDAISCKDFDNNKVRIFGCFLFLPASFHVF